MQPFSIASVAASCTTISNRALATASELDDILGLASPRDSPTESLASVHALLHHISSQTKQLQEWFAESASIPETLRTNLPRWLDTCDSALAVMDKQLRRLHSINPEVMIDSGVVRSYASYLDFQTQLFESCQSALATGTPEEQEELLKGKDAQKAVSAAKQAARRIMQRAEILVPQVDAQPPAYAIPSPTAAESSKGSGFLAGLTETFHALTAAMRPKPEPFVVPLCQAALRGDLGQIKGLLAHGVNVNGLNEDGSTALICAAKASQHATARFLIANGADVSTRDRQGFPPLFRATETGDLEMISLLIDLGADPNEHGDPSQPFFVDVAAKSPLPVVNLLLDRGADVHTRTIYGTSIFVNAVKAENIPLIKLLARRGADVRSKDLYGDSPLTIAVLSNSDTSMELAQFFLDHGAKATLRAHDGRLLVVIAIENGRLDLAELLLGRGADPNSKTQSGERVLVKALKQGSLPMAKLFADRGADLNFTSRFGGSESLTPLMYAITRDQWDMAELIVRRGGNANTPDKKGRTPLLESLQKDHARMVSLLLQHGADLNQEGVMTPAAFARISGRHDFVELLRSRGSRGLAADPFVEPSQAGSSRPGPPSPNHPPNDGEAPPDYHSATRSSA